MTDTDHSRQALAQTALDARRIAGLCPLPVAADGTKRPGLASWSKYQDTPPGMIEVMSWFSGTHHTYDGWGTVCGAVSGRLVCLDIEAAFAQQDGSFLEMSRRLEAAGLLDEFEAAMHGYTEETPAGGVHILVRLMDGPPVPGNTKIALAADHSTLIETRGEGGFVILAPSFGRTHPSGKPWILHRGDITTIAYWTPEVYEAIVNLLCSFDESPPAPEPPPIVPRGLRLAAGGGWIDDALNQVDDLSMVLIRLGWVYVRSDTHGQLWRRPGKSIGVSGRINASGRLMVFSTSTPLDASKRTYDALDVILAYDLGHPPTLDERTEYLRQFRPEQAQLRHPSQQPVELASDPVVEQTQLYLPDSFWQATPLLTQLYEESLLHLNSPDGVFGALESLYAMTIPMTYWIPPIVGEEAPLNLFSVLVALSGGGKTTAMAAASKMLALPPNPDLKHSALRSGEGLIHLARKPTKKVDGEVQPQAYNTGVHISFDEGGSFSAQQERSGQTAIPYLNTAWSGLGLVGGAKAEGELSFPADLVRVCATIGVQFGKAQNLFTGDSARMGFPQRLTFFGLDHPEIQNAQRQALRPVHQLGVRYWQRSHGRVQIPFSDEIKDEVWAWTKAAKAGRVDALDSHRMNLRLRHAAVLAMMHDQTNDLDFFWALAAQIMDTSLDRRSALIRSFDRLDEERDVAVGRSTGRRGDATHRYHVERVLLRLIPRMRSVGDEGITKKDLKNWAGRDRQYLQEALDLGVQLGRFVHRDGRFFCGER